MDNKICSVCKKPFDLRIHGGTVYRKGEIVGYICNQCLHGDKEKEKLRS